MTDQDVELTLGFMQSSRIESVRPVGLLEAGTECFCSVQKWSVFSSEQLTKHTLHWYLLGSIIPGNACLKPNWP